MRSANVVLVALALGLLAPCVGCAVGSELGRRFGDTNRWDDIAWGFLGFLGGVVTAPLLVFAALACRWGSDESSDVGDGDG